jgi:hypothetical protein
MMRTNTKKFEVLKFIGSHRDGVRSRDVEQFIVTKLQHKTWDPKRRAGLWNTSLYGMSGHGGIYRDHCIRVGDRWFLNQKTREIVAKANPGEMFFGKTATPSLADTPCKSDVIHPGTPEAKVMHMPPLQDRPVITPEVSAITDLKAARAKVLMYKQAYDKAAQYLLDAQAQEAAAATVVKKVLGL